LLARIMRLVLQLEAPACYKLVVSVPAFLSAPSRCRCLPTRPDGPGESLVHRATVPGVPVERIRQPWAGGTARGSLRLRSRPVAGCLADTGRRRRPSVAAALRGRGRVSESESPWGSLGGCWSVLLC
jgi:hypothetical protein